MSKRITRFFVWLTLVFSVAVQSNDVRGAVIATWDFTDGDSAGKVVAGYQAEVTTFATFGTFAAGGLNPAGVTSNRWRTGGFSNTAYNLNNGISLSFKYNGPVSFNVTRFDFSFANVGTTTRRWVRVDYQVNTGAKEFLVEASRTSTTYGINQMLMDETLTSGDIIWYYFVFRRDVAGTNLSMDIDAIKLYGYEIPEPSSALILGGLGVLASGFYYRRRRAIGV